MRSRCWSWALALFAVALPACAQQKIAFTWDDLPAHSTLPAGETRQHIIEAIIGATRAEHLPAPYGFVNAKRIASQPELMGVLDAWRAAGFPLGNHAWSHMNLSDPATTLEAWEQDVLEDEPVLSKEMGSEDFHWFRYPNLGEGDTPEKKLVARRFLAEHRYKIAPVTMSFADYAYNEPYARCLARDDKAAVRKLEDSYLEEAEKNLIYAHQISQALYARDIPYILLMHVGALDAKLLPRLLQLYRRHGASFISLQEAMKDPFYANALDPTLDPLPNTLEEAMELKRLPLPARTPPSVDVSTICR